MADPTVLLLSTSDTDLISARSSGKNYRWANPSRLSEAELPDLLADTSIVVVRILGGYRAWQSGIDAVIASGIPTVLVSGEQAADAELTGLSTVAAGIAVQAHIYLAHGGVDNLRQLHAFLTDTVLMTGFGFSAARGDSHLGRARAAERSRPPGPDDRGAVLPRTAPGRQHRLRRVAVPGHRGCGRAAAARLLRLACAPPNPNCCNGSATPTRWWSPCWRPGD